MLESTVPFSYLKRKVRRLARQAQNWSTIVKLTIEGNKVERNFKLKNARNPVLMIYGFGASRRTMAILENRLRQDGYTIFSINLGGILGTFNTDSIEQTARKVDTKVEALYKKYNIKGRLSIVGHSKGGLIGQYYIKFLNGKRVRTFITMGTPHNGNPWASIGAYTPVGWVCPSVKQMAPHSEFIQKLKSTPFPKHIKVFSIFSKADTVCPFPVSVLEESSQIKNIEIPNVTHSELLIKKNVYNAIKHALNDEMPESWTETTQQNIEEHFKRSNRFKVIK